MTQTVATRSATSDPALARFWSLTAAQVDALVDDQARDGRTTTRRPRSPGTARLLSWLRVIGRQFLSPITLILIVAALIATTAGDSVDGTIILAIVVCSALLGAWQEGRAAEAVASLLSRVAVTVQVERGGQKLAVQTTDVRPGDRVLLAAGDIVPGDCLLLDSHDLTVDESALTGESFPASKLAGDPLPPDTALAARTNSIFSGTHVVSGTGSALVVLVGEATAFGHIRTSLSKKAQSTSFEVGVRRFGMLLLRVMVILVGVILIINLIDHRPLIDSLLFALALAVGITPQMLPVVVTVSLAAGARRLARSQVIVKRLDVIEDLGAMSVLCTDKTGTITLGTVDVDQALGADGAEDPAVLELSVLNAGLQTGYPNPLDAAILAERKLPDGATLLDELPYDFERKRLSVVTTYLGKRTLITKGSLDSVLACSSSAATAEGPQPLSSLLAGIQQLSQTKGEDGYRVLGVAYRVLDESTKDLEPTDEKDLTFAGILTFHDPVKPGVDDSIASLASLGVRVKVVSGDNRYVTGSLAPQLGLAGRVVLGSEIEEADDARARDLVTTNSLFAEVEPMHKVKIVRTLKSCGETVGFLGDGINDAGALHTADVGLSVDTAVNVAKEAAAIVLLTRDLGVVADGVKLGRHTFANTLKYVRVAASANFGNILSMVLAAALLPFLPMLPSQILLLNFLADVPNTLVSRDRVDSERLVTAGAWDMRALTRFMVMFGAASTAFDLASFGVMSWVFHTDATLFHTGWFVLSAITQFVAMMTLRTSRRAWRSTPDGVFLAVSAAIAVVTAVLPFTPLAGVLGFTAVPIALLAALVGLAVLYGLANEALKRFIRF